MAYSINKEKFTLINKNNESFVLDKAKTLFWFKEIVGQKYFDLNDNLVRHNILYQVQFSVDLIVSLQDLKNLENNFFVSDMILFTPELVSYSVYLKNPIKQEGKLNFEFSTKVKIELEGTNKIKKEDIKKNVLSVYYTEQENFLVV